MPDGWEGTIREMAARLKLNPSDGSIYTYLKLLIQNGVLREVGEVKVSYLGRRAKVYRFSKENYYKLLIKINDFVAKLYDDWINNLNAP